MPQAPCYIVSDLHLGVRPSEYERDFVAFLRSLPGRAASLVINGDLFEFWFEWRHVIPRAHFRTLAALADLRDAGIEVLMLGGNHDGWGGEVLRRDVGLTYLLHAWRGELAGWRAHVEHGDGLRAAEDRTYRMLRRVLRSRAAIRAFRAIHPDWASRLALRSSHASRAHSVFGDAGAGLRLVAHEMMARERSLELVVFGHSHAATLDRAPSGGVYGNAGTWLRAPTYLVVTPDRIELRQWGGSGSAEGDCLDALDRLAEKALREP